MKRGEIWLVNLDPTYGTEIKKTRPCVVVSVDEANDTIPRLIVVPLTSNTRSVHAGQTLIDVNGTISKATCDQMRAVDKKRIYKKLGAITKFEMLALEKAMLVLLGLPL